MPPPHAYSRETNTVGIEGIESYIEKSLCNVSVRIVEKPSGTLFEICLTSDFVLRAIPLPRLGCGRILFIEDHEALKTRAVVRELAQAVEHQVNDLLALVGLDILFVLILSHDSFLPIQ